MGAVGVRSRVVRRVAPPQEEQGGLRGDGEERLLRLEADAEGGEESGGEVERGG